jgi:hypothetical protein
MLTNLDDLRVETVKQDLDDLWLEITNTTSDIEAMIDIFKKIPKERRDEFLWHRLRLIKGMANLMQDYLLLVEES